MNRFKELFNRDSAQWLQVSATALGLGVAFGLFGLDADTAATVQAVIIAVFGVFAALQVKPIAPTVFGTLITATSVLLARFGLEWTSDQVGAVQLAVAGVVALLVRPQQTPVRDPRPDAMV